MPNYDVDKFADKLPSDVPLGSSESRRLLRDMAIRLISLAEMESEREAPPRPAPVRQPKVQAPSVTYAPVVTKEIQPLKGGPAPKAAGLSGKLLSTKEGTKRAESPTGFETITTVKGTLPTNPKKPFIPKQVSKRPLKGRLVQHKFEV